MLIDCKLIFGLRAKGLMLSGESFFNDSISVGYGVRRQYLFSSGFNCTSLWLFSDPHGTAVSQKQVIRESLTTKYVHYFNRILGFFYSIFYLQTHIRVILFCYKCNTIVCFLRSQKNLICYLIINILHKGF